ncbi:NAD(P)/FAD-dependent oxidoreductase [Allopusillimonas ginsengisoli]|uniref:NAD(P)/FAD-dependent oxidoreductase n=1 Tax=Allopusillimonas ginsengisoli TaxID=453575 RepID=UPI00101EA512|nr:NAD(P)/FAD-dependent oxidoreductase [Allopusillimonas ginsengisoli]TEA77134.1 flavocytochrome C [Allopusillimonas ginsengisoli]
MKRRSFIKSLAGLAAVSCPVLAGARSSASPHVVVVGGGFGGATAAKYLHLFSGGRIRVTLVEPRAEFVSTPLSNLVLEGRLSMRDISRSYEGLAQYGVRHVRDEAVRVDATRRTLELRQGDPLSWDRLILSPGIDFMWERIPGLKTEDARNAMPHAWKAGPQTQLLRQQLEAMPDGGRFIMTIPETPYRCPPAPYERACLVAAYFKQHKPRATVHIFDANAEVTSEAEQFHQAWEERYPGMIEYNPAFKAVDVDADTRTVIFELGEEEQGDVVNVIPPMRAGNIARQAELATANDRWCEVDFLTFSSIVDDRIHVLGDSVQIAPVMPKAGHMASQHGKTCAAAVAALLLGQEVNQDPLYASICYSFVNAQDAMHVASVHRYSQEEGTMLPVKGGGGVSEHATADEGQMALDWAHAIWADMLT